VPLLLEDEPSCLVGSACLVLGPLAAALAAPWLSDALPPGLALALALLVAVAGGPVLVLLALGAMGAGSRALRAMTAGRGTAPRPTREGGLPVRTGFGPG